MTEASELHAATEAAFNRGDVEALVDLYDDAACLVGPDGSPAHGKAAIREVWTGFVALGGQMQMTTRYCIANGDLALLSNEWHFTSDAMSFAGVSAEVAVRSEHGWRYLVDNPMAHPA
jgi:ketosteroid isomerase-like protein